MALKVDPAKAWERYHQQTIDSNDVNQLLHDMLNMTPWSYNMERHKLFVKFGGIAQETWLLDAGCGTGKVAFGEAALTGCRVTLLDYSKEALSYSQQILSALHRRGRPIQADFCRGDLKSLPFSGVFDLVCNEGVIEHWQAYDDRLHIMRQMVQAAKPGGKVIVLVPNRNNRFYQEWVQTLDGVPDEWAFTDVELKGLLEDAGLKGVQVIGFRPYKTFMHHNPIFTGKWKFVAGGLWIIEKLMPRWMYRSYAIRLGHYLVGIGERPVQAE